MIFSVLWELQLLKINLIGSTRCFLLLWLLRVMTLVLIFRQSFETRSDPKNNCSVISATCPELKSYVGAFPTHPTLCGHWFEHLLRPCNILIGDVSLRSLGKLVHNRFHDLQKHWMNIFQLNIIEYTLSYQVNYPASRHSYLIIFGENIFQTK